MLLTAMSLNVHGVLTPGLAKIIREVDPDLLLGQELYGWASDPRLIARAEHDLGLRALVAPSATGANTGTLYRQSRFRWIHFETKYGPETHHGFGVAVLHASDLPEPVNVISAHVRPGSPGTAAAELELMAWRLCRYAPRLGLGLLGGDINYVGIGDPQPDWHAPNINAINRMSRAIEQQDGSLSGNEGPARVLARAELIDAAAYLADLHNAAKLRGPTAYGGIRCDQIHLTPHWRPALLTPGRGGYEIIDTGSDSDHQAIVVRLDTSLIDQDTTWP